MSGKKIVAFGVRRDRDKCYAAGGTSGRGKAFFGRRGASSSIINVKNSAKAKIPNRYRYCINCVPPAKAPQPYVGAESWLTNIIKTTMIAKASAVKQIK